MIEQKNTFFVLTGGPGSGKSTLIDALRKRGIATVAESGRQIIQTQMAIGGDALPWENPLDYAKMDLGIGLVRFRETDAQRTTIFDRGILDPLGFLTVIGHDIPSFMHTAASQYRYNSQVFIAPPWKEIYCLDTERKQDFQEAVATYDAMMKIYGDAGYELVELPRTSVLERLDFVWDKILEHAKV
jgi:predicted ATPase